MPVQSPTCRIAIFDPWHACERRDGRLLTDADIAAGVECFLEASRQAHTPRCRCCGDLPPATDRTLCVECLEAGCLVPRACDRTMAAS